MKPTVIFDYSLSRSELRQIPDRLPALVAGEWRWSVEPERSLHPELMGSEGCWRLEQAGCVAWCYHATIELRVGVDLLGLASQPERRFQVEALLKKFGRRLGASRMLVFPESGSEASVSAAYARAGWKIADIVTKLKKQGISAVSTLEDLVKVHDDGCCEFNGYCFRWLEDSPPPLEVEQPEWLPLITPLGLVKNVETEVFELQPQKAWTRLKGSMLLPFPPREEVRPCDVLVDLDVIFLGVEAVRYLQRPSGKERGIIWRHETDWSKSFEALHPRLRHYRILNPTQTCELLAFDHVVSAVRSKPQPPADDL